jgi:hypothetical protein
LVLEADAVSVALSAHGPQDADKFVQEVIWPHATAGFFKVKKNIPRILEQVGLA